MILGSRLVGIVLLGWIFIVRQIFLIASSNGRRAAKSGCGSSMSYRLPSGPTGYLRRLANERSANNTITL